MAERRRIVETRPVTGRARGLVSGRTSGSRIDAARSPAPADLEDVVECFWSGAWDLRGQAPHETLLLSDPCVHLVAEHGDQAAGGQESRVVGVWTRLWQRRLQDRGAVRGVKIRAGAMRAFIDLPTHKLTNCIVPLTEQFAGGAQAFEHAALTPTDDGPAWAAVAEWLRRQRRPRDPLVAQAVALLDVIREQTDILHVDALARQAGVSPRALQRLFRDYIGGTPKWAIRRNRLQEAASRLEAGDQRLADVAATLGYTDQAHFTHDFRAATGMSPGRFAVGVHRG